MPQTREEIQEERRRLRAQYHHLFDDVQALLFRHDPVGINFETNTDEYDPEVGTILPRLRSCTCAADVGSVVHEEFTRWFDADIAGPRERYSAIASEIWALWQQFRNAEPDAAPNSRPPQQLPASPEVPSSDSQRTSSSGGSP